KTSPAITSLANFAAHGPLMRDMIDPTLVPLGGAVPSPDLLPAQKLARLGASIVRAEPLAGISYDPAPGCPRPRRELSRRSLDWGCALEPDDFIVTTGATEALFLALQAVTAPGDTVIVESPTYHGLLNVLAQLKRRVIAIPTAADGIDLAG